MADLRGNPPLYTSMVQESPNDSTKHQLAQGWIQWFSQLILAMQGIWIQSSNTISFSSTEPKNYSFSSNPYSSFLLINFELGSEAQTITLDFSCDGLIIISQNGALSSIYINGKSFNIPILGINTIITATIRRV